MKERTKEAKEKRGAEVRRRTSLMLEQEIAKLTEEDLEEGAKRLFGFSADSVAAQVSAEREEEEGAEETEEEQVEEFVVFNEQGSSEPRGSKLSNRGLIPDPH